MNKKYIQPRTYVTNVMLQQIIATSDPQVGINKADPGVAPGSFDVKHRDDDDFDFGGEGGDWSDDLW